MPVPTVHSPPPLIPKLDPISAENEVELLEIQPVRDHCGLPIKHYRENLLIIDALMCFIGYPQESFRQGQ